MSLKTLVQEQVSAAFAGPLRDFIESVRYTEAGGYDPLTDSHGTLVDQTVNAIVLQYNEKEIASTLAKASDRKVIFDKPNLGFTLNVGGKLQIAGVEYEIKSAPSDPAGATIEAWAVR